MLTPEADGSSSRLGLARNTAPNVLRLDTAATLSLSCFSITREGANPMTQTLGQTIDAIESQYAAEYERLLKKQDQLAAEIEAKQKELSTTETSITHIEREKSRTIRKALLEAGIAVVQVSKQPSGNGSAPRLSSEEMEKARQAVSVVLPLPGKSFRSKSDIAKRTGLDSAVVHSALLSLRRDGKSQTNGARGYKAGWQKA